MIVDKFGHCIKCGKNLIIEKVIAHEVKKVITPEYDQMQFILDDDSKMRIVICKLCKSILKEKDYPTVMRSVIAGWQAEVNGIDNWDEKKKREHMRKYRRKKIKYKDKEFKYGASN